MMIFISIEDFYEKVKSCVILSREEEKKCAAQMKQGDLEARERLVQSYLPMGASRIKRTAPHMQTLGLVLYCQQTLEQLVDKFNFQQDSETFTHRLNWGLRQAVTRYIVK